MLWTRSEEGEGRQFVLLRCMGVPNGRTIQHVRLRLAMSDSCSLVRCEEPLSVGGDPFRAPALLGRTHVDSRPRLEVGSPERGLSRT